MAYSAIAMLQDRISKTFARLRAGELPPPTAVKTLPATAQRTTCSGCSEPIEPRERYSYIRSDATVLRFHLICHEAWIRFRRPA